VNIDWRAEIAAFALRAESLNDEEFAKLCLDHPHVAIEYADESDQGGRLLADRALFWQVLAKEPYEAAVYLICSHRDQLSDDEVLRAMEECADANGYMNFSCDYTLHDVIVHVACWEPEEVEAFLRLLATSPNPRLRRVVAGFDENPPSDLLAELSVDPEEVVRTAAYRNPQATEEMRIQAAILGVQQA
jgi:hypothetical protein